MKTISLVIDDRIFKESEKILLVLKKPRNRYINEAIDYFNAHHKRMILEKELKKESGMVGEESLNVLKDFEDIDYGD